MTDDNISAADWQDIRSSAFDFLAGSAAASEVMPGLRARCDQLLASARDGGLTDAQAAVIICGVMSKQIREAFGPALVMLLGPDAPIRYASALLLQALE